MPQIRPITDLRNTNEISEICHARPEPVFITKNGYGDLVIMSIETYEQLVGRFELYGLLQDGLNDVKNENTRPFAEAISDLRSRRKR